MNRNHSTPLISGIAFILTGFLFLGFSSKATNPPFILKNGLFDQKNLINLGIIAAEGTETYSIFEPVDSTNKFTNGVVMTAFKNQLYCMWQSSANDEDAADTWVAYSKSDDGIKWTAPMELAATIPDGYCSSGGWWSTNDTLVGFVNVWPDAITPRGGFTYYKTSTDGLNWSVLKPVLMANGDTLNGIFEQDPHALPDGRIINAVHFQPGLIICPVYTDDHLGIRGWTKAQYKNMSIENGISREIEPSWFLRSDDTLVMTFRDQNSSFKRLASVSGDRGESWSTAVLTAMPDARTKQSAGNLPDGTSYMVGNPVNNKTRIPLAVTLSKNGYFFNTAYILREGGDRIQPLRTEGKAKRLGYHYPKSMVYNNYLYVSYATNKEDAQYTRVPLSSLVLDTTTANIEVQVDTTSNVSATNFSDNEHIKIHIEANEIISISLDDNFSNARMSVFNLNGQLIYRNKIIQKETLYDMKQHSVGNYIVVIETNKNRRSQLFRIK